MNYIYLFKKSKNYIKFKYLKIIYLKNNINYPRLYFLIKKKYIKKSCNRNLFKRIVKEFFRINSKNMLNMDFLITSKLINIINNKILFNDVEKIFSFFIKK